MHSTPRIVTVARFFLGLTFVVFGFDGVLHFMPLPPMPDAAKQVIEVLISYRLFYAVKALEVLAGLLLLTGRTLEGAVLLAPVLFNIVWFDLFLDAASLPVALLLLGAEGVVLWHFRARLRPLVDREVAPAP